jgi:hypothetical protein
MKSSVYWEGFTAGIRHCAGPVSPATKVLVLRAPKGGNNHPATRVMLDELGEHARQMAEFCAKWRAMPATVNGPEPTFGQVEQAWCALANAVLEALDCTDLDLADVVRRARAAKAPEDPPTLPSLPRGREEVDPNGTPA